MLQNREGNAPELGEANAGPQIDISDDGFLNLMTADGDLKDDVRMPEGDVAAKINKLFVEDEKDTRMSKTKRHPPS
jgi:hypothetical protein